MFLKYFWEESFIFNNPPLSENLHLNYFYQGRNINFQLFILLTLGYDGHTNNNYWFMRELEKKRKLNDF